MHPLTTSPRSGGDILRTQFFVQLCLESGDFPGGLLVHSTLGFLERIPGDEPGIVWHRGRRRATAMLVADTGDGQLFLAGGFVVTNAGIML